MRPDRFCRRTKFNLTGTCRHVGSSHNSNKTTLLRKHITFYRNGDHHMCLQMLVANGLSCKFAQPAKRVRCGCVGVGVGVCGGGGGCGCGGGVWCVCGCGCVGVCVWGCVCVCVGWVGGCADGCCVGG